MDQNSVKTTRHFTKKELKAAGQIAMSIVKAAKQHAFLHEFTTECINAYDLPGYPPNTKQRLDVFNVLLELAKDIIRQKPPPQPNTFAFMQHIISWTGEQ
jgi:hypothetical protein